MEYLKGYDKELFIVIGYDGCKNLDVFVCDIVEIMVGVGIKVYLLLCKLLILVLVYVI